MPAKVRRTEQRGVQKKERKEGGSEARYERTNQSSSRARAAASGVVCTRCISGFRARLREHVWPIPNTPKQEVTLRKTEFSMRLNPVLSLPKCVTRFCVAMRPTTGGRGGEEEAFALSPDNGKERVWGAAAAGRARGFGNRRRRDGGDCGMCAYCAVRHLNYSCKRGVV